MGVLSSSDDVKIGTEISAIGDKISRDFTAISENMSRYAALISTATLDADDKTRMTVFIDQQIEVANDLIAEANTIKTTLNG